MATVDKPTTVAENVPKVYHAGQMTVVENAECLKGSKSGSAMLIDDVSPVEHTMGVKVRGKNILPLADSGIYYKGSIVSTKPFIAYSSYGISDFNNIDVSTNRGVYAVIKLTEGETYTLTINNLVNNCATKQINLTVGFRSSESTIFGTSETGNSVSSGYNQSSLTFTVPSGYPYCLVGLYNYPTVSGDTISFNAMQLELGTTATPYTPYVPDLTAVTVSRYGKNLWDKDYANIRSNWTNLVGGYASINIRVPQGKKISVSHQKALPTDVSIQMYVLNGSTQVWMHSKNTNRNKVTFTASTNRIRITVAPTPAGTQQYLNLFMENIGNDLQIEIGSTATAYEPYITPTDYTPTADGTVEGVESLYPSTTLLTNDPYGKVYIDCDYYKDIDKTFNELTTSVALSGGE